MRVWGFGSNNAIISNVGQVFYGTLVCLVLNLMLFYSVCNSLQVSLLLQSLTGPKYPTVIKGIETA